VQQKARSVDFVSSNRLALSGSRFTSLTVSRTPSLTALFSQVASVLVTLALVAIVSFKVEIPSIFVIFIQGGIAALIGLRLGLAPWWLPINLLFTPALVLALSFGVAPSWFLAAFLLLLLAYWSVFRSQVPLYLSSRKAWAAVANLLPCKPDFCLLDVGAGLGGMLGYLSLKRLDGRFYGMEIAPLPFALAWLRRKAGRGMHQIRWGDFWSHNFAAYDVVYAYLSPVPMARLWAKACTEMATGSRFISNTFPVFGAEPEEIVDLDDFHHSRLYVYRIPARPLVEEAP